jgi:iron-sulfur cluster repair protein YtfE (RIC family)
MVVQLGKKKHPDTVTGRLLDCHDRIRRFVAMAGRIGTLEEATEAEVRSAAHDVRRYFVEALPLHVQDEEESLLPRLRGREVELDAALDRMHAEHEIHEPLLRSLVAICETLLSAPARRDALRSELIATAAELDRELVAHLAAEEALIFPALERVLDERARAEIISEMALRRR